MQGLCVQERQTRQNSGGVGEVYNSASIFKKVHFLPFLSKTIKKDLLLDFYFLAFLRKAIKKKSIFKKLNVKKSLIFTISTLND